LTAELDRLHDGLAAVDAIIAKAIGISEVARIARIETRLREYLNAKWNARKRRAVERAGSMARAGKSAAEISRAVKGIMSGWAREIAPRYKRDFREIYRLARIAGWKKGGRLTRGTLAYKGPSPFTAEVKKGDLWSIPIQEVTSEDTSVNTIPSVFRRAKFRRGRVNADIGGGKYETATRYLSGRGVTNVVWDPFARTPEHNKKAAARIRNGGAATATVANVLNVIKDPKARDRVIRQAANAVGKNGVAYFQVYEGDGSGKGGKTDRGWQANKSLSAYVESIARVFRYVIPRNGYLEARQRNPEEIKELEKATVPRAAVALPTFDVVDTAAAGALVDRQVFWIGRHYDDNISQSIRDTARGSLIEAGTNRQRAGELMQQRVAENLSHVRTPRGWHGTQAQYFEGLAANAATVGRVHGQMRSFIDLGITKYEIRHPSDSRTCRVCAHMDGKVFTVAQGAQQMQQELAIAEIPGQSPEEYRDAVKAVHPWIQDSNRGMEKLNNIGSGLPGKQGPADAQAYAEAGLSLPPYHYRCRCTVDVSTEAGSWEAFGAESVPIPTPPGVKPPTKPFPPFKTHPTKPINTFSTQRLSAALGRKIRTTAGNAKAGVAITPQAQIAARQELNGLLAEYGLVSKDAIRGLDDAIAMLEVLETEHMVGVLGTHSWQGAIRMRSSSIDDAIDLLDGKIKPAKAGTMQAIKNQDRVHGMKTLVHEGVHGHSPLLSEAYYGMGVPLEEGAVELTAQRIMKDKFGLLWQEVRASDYKEYVEALADTVEGAFKKVVGRRKAWQAYSDKFVEESKVIPYRKSNVGRHLASDATIRMQSTSHFISTHKQFLDDFAAAVEVPSELTAGLSKQQIKELTEKIRKEVRERSEKKLVTAVRKRAKRRGDPVPKARYMRFSG